MGNFWKNEIYRNDVKTALSHTVNEKTLAKKKVLVTGASGLIGSFVTDVLREADAEVFVAGRKPEILRKRFLCEAFPYDVTKEIGFDENFDYVIHAAGYGHPAAFRNDPVGTLLHTANGTARLLEYSLRHKVKRFLYVSSGEVYGGIDSMNMRSCYPLGKQAGENLCAAYYEKYGLQTVVARLCHTFGPAMAATDNRAATEFFRKAINGEDIVLTSKGNQRRSYLYAADSASAMLSVLTAGEGGKAYDVAAKDCVVTIAELAEMIAKEAGVRVRYALPDEAEKAMQSPIKDQVLDEGNLFRIGWENAFSVEAGIREMVKILS